MSIISESFRDPYGHQVIGHLSKSDDKWYGLRMTNKPITKDLVGVNVAFTLDGMSSIHIGIRDYEYAGECRRVAADTHILSRRLAMYRERFSTSTDPADFPGALVQLTRPKQMFV